MNRYRSSAAAMLLVAATVLVLRSTRANDDERPVSAMQIDEILVKADLIERIEDLEKRLQKLEGQEPLIRQADSREASDVEYQPIARPLAPSRFSPESDPDEEIQNTNGLTWQFRLLELRKECTPKIASEKSDKYY